MKRKISKTQIRMGVSEELEHTRSKRVARKIAMDHLNEHPTYYTHLKHMKKTMLKKRKR